MFVQHDYNFWYIILANCVQPGVENSTFWNIKLKMKMDFLHFSLQPFGKSKKKNRQKKIIQNE
jgi:hypothetical protein